MIGIITGVIGAIVTGAVAVSKALAVIGLAVQGLKVVGNAIASIAKALGIIKPERDVEEIGDRALQAEEKGITPDKCESYAAWVKEIEKDDWGYDPEKNKEMSPEEKMLKGVEVSTAVVIEKFPDLPIQDFFTVASKKPDFFSVERMSEIGSLASNDPDVFGCIVNYVTGGIKDHSIKDMTEDTLMDIEKKVDPGIDDNAAYDRVASFYQQK